MYADLGHTTANVMVGILSAIVDNIPVMFAVLTMDPHMSRITSYNVCYTKLLRRKKKKAICIACS